jgi:putative transposase
VKVKLHRWYATPAEGGTAEPRKIVVRRRGTGRARRWEVTVFWRGVQVPKPNPTGRRAGVDVGVAVLAAVADDQGGVELIENPRHLTRKLDQLARAQRALAACAKTGRRDGAGRRNKAKARVTRLHRQVRDARKGFNHQLSRRLADSFDEVFFEDLSIANMTRSAAGTLESPGSNVAAKAGLNRSILDAGWGQLVAFTSYKAASAGRTVSKVKAAHTSQTCASCGHTDPASRATRDHFRCTSCGHEDHADSNAARVVLAVGEGRLTLKQPRGRRQKSRPGSGHPPVTAGRDAA